MKAMILAAGFGTRLRPLTNDTPKPLLPLGGCPLIEWNLLLLRKYGITQVIVNLHYLGHVIEKAVGDGSRLGMQVTYSREEELLGSGGGIKQVEWFFQGEPLLVLNGDTLLDMQLGRLIDYHCQQEALATMVIRRDPEAEQWGPVLVSSQGRVLQINGRGLPVSEPAATMMFAGVHILHPRLLADVPFEKASSIIPFYQSALSRHERICGFCMEGYWSDIGTVERYRQAERDVQAGCLSLDRFRTSHEG